MEKKNIAYIELDTHPEILSNFMSLMNFSDKFTVDYYISEKIDRLRFSDNSNIEIVSPENLLSKISNKQYDLVIIGTIHRYFSVFSNINSRFKTVVIVHNINFSQASKIQLLKNVFQKEVLFRIKLLLKEGLLSAPYLHKNILNKLVLDESFVSNNHVFLPIFFSQEQENFNPNHKLNVVIPGTVSQKRRDYERVLKQLHFFKKEIAVVFLGKASGTELTQLKAAQKSLPQHITLIYFEEKLSGDEFLNYMSKADVLWCPVQSKTDFFGITEWYGRTKMSGNIGDAIQFKKPAVFPSNYNSNYPFVFNEEDDIEEQLHRLAHQNIDFNNFNKGIVLKRLEKVLETLI